MPGGIWRCHIERESTESVLILTISGRLGTAAAPALRDAVTQAVREAPAVVVDLQEVDYISGAGLAALEAAAAQGNGAFVLCALTPPVQIALELAGLHHVLAVASDCAAALERVRSATGAKF